MGEFRKEWKQFAVSGGLQERVGAVRSEWGSSGRIMRGQEEIPEIHLYPQDGAVWPQDGAVWPQDGAVWPQDGAVWPQDGRVWKTA